MATYVPRVLICGDAQEFRKIIGDKPVEVVGQIISEGTGDDIKLFFGGQSLRGEDISRLLDGTAEYLIFTDALDFSDYLEVFPRNTQAMGARAFAEKIHGGFYSTEMFAQMVEVLKNFSGRVLDFDCFVGKTDFRTKLDWRGEIDCFAPDGLAPIMKNLYGKIFRTPDEFRYRTFDAVLLTAERSPDEFVDALIDTDGLSKNILAFARKNSALESWLTDSKNIFAADKVYAVPNGAWWLLEKISLPADVGVYIVTHKDAKLAAPDGYKIIHAGHALATENFGDVADDTGDNISRLNPFLDEITALYWIWRNTSHTITGICHYRRLFTTTTNQREHRPFEFVFKPRNILSRAEILKLLDEYDIILHTELVSDRTQRELMILSTGQPKLVDFAEKIVRKHLARAHPDYLDAFDAVMGGFVFFSYGIHVTRRKIFDDYCAWLFDFIIGATIELRDRVNISGYKLEELPHFYSRMMSFIAERMLTVWLTKTHLRIKTLPIMYRDDI
ncbi:MAG: DUF4422 domain-containing protein [Quinella sp. 1Q7]|nr:DUF4422 domain-containing protein [Quinella sp. 1Q7]